MKHGEGWTLTMAITAALTLAGCSAEGDASAGSTRSPEAGPSPVEVKDGRLCPFFVSAEKEKLRLSNDLGPNSRDEAAAERMKEREKREGVLDKCDYTGPLAGGGPLEQVTVRLKKGSAAELGKKLKGYEPRNDAKRSGIAFQAETALSGTVVCRLLAPGRSSTDGGPATTVELTAYVPFRSIGKWQPGDSCAAMNKAAPLIEKKFRPR
ncbi:hypothetical protein E0L36_22855 [Streptomyces sp. AJS327]|uniref:hypothetical protein n=1 Tax=Streptomyces sp. AJS327 TaxID=2545265 RepID=UPI0015DFB340|nr:hypothetical protein [Streptomyces sp. AJS327]MBA0053607.1 hypothetical protein [Streptomyces sp. AJS327]